MEDKIRAILSANLRKYRGRREWSQIELAEKADIAPNFLSEIERGNKWPSSGTLQNIADSLGIEAHELFVPENEENPSIDKYMERYSRDVMIAVQESVKKSLRNVRKRYKHK